jgi:hypothetical protein
MDYDNNYKFIFILFYKNYVKNKTIAKLKCKVKIM